MCSSDQGLEGLRKVFVQRRADAEHRTASSVFEVFQKMGFVVQYTPLPGDLGPSALFLLLALDSHWLVGRFCESPRQFDCSLRDPVVPD